MNDERHVFLFDLVVILVEPQSVKKIKHMVVAFDSIENLKMTLACNYYRGMRISYLLTFTPKVLINQHKLEYGIWNWRVL